MDPKPQEDEEFELLDDELFRELVEEDLLDDEDELLEDLDL